MGAVALVYRVFARVRVGARDNGCVGGMVVRARVRWSARQEMKTPHLFLTRADWRELNEGGLSMPMKVGVFVRRLKARCVVVVECGPSLSL